jgi:predicted RNase H-like HicB family nuclease
MRAKEMNRMNKKLWDTATKLAARPYQVRVYRDDEASGEAIYLAEYAELSGCMAQGATIRDALTNLREAAMDYIYSLLEDGLEVPPPLYIAVQTGGVVETFGSDVHGTQL